MCMCVSMIRLFPHPIPPYPAPAPTPSVCAGAFGRAIVYRRRDDDSYVILKEINMVELPKEQRRLALNEVEVLSRLDHPNIISFYDSFEEDGTLMIEMEYAEKGCVCVWTHAHVCVCVCLCVRDRERG